MTPAEQTGDMPRCETCRHYRHSGYWGGMACANERVDEMIYWNDVMDEHTFKPPLMPPPDFGCTQHEPRKEA